MAYESSASRRLKQPPLKDSSEKTRGLIPALASVGEKWSDHLTMENGF